MQIDPRNSGNVPGLRPTADASADPATDSTAQATGAVAPAATAFSPTPVLLGLLAQLGLVPAVRTDAVAQAADQLARGELLTPAAALQTAQAILATESVAG